MALSFKTLTHPLPIMTAAAALILLSTGCGTKTSAKPKAQLNIQLEAIRQAGLPVTLAELNDWYAEPPASENAAPLYSEALAGLEKGEPGSPAFLARNRKALDLLHQAGSMKKCRYPTDLSKGAAAMLPHLTMIKRGAQLLSQAASAHAANGEMDQAVQCFVDGFRLTRSLDEEPILLSFMVQAAAQNLLETSLESILNRKTFSEEQLARLQSALGELEPGASLSRRLAGERCMGIAVFQSPPGEQLQPLAQLQKPPVTMDFKNYVKSPAFEADFNSYLGLMDQGIAAAALPFPGSLEAIAKWSAEAKRARNAGCPISKMLLPALDSAFERAAECTGRLRAAQTALAVERYRLSHANTLPSSLAQLTPKLLAEVLADPFDGQPLRYEKMPSAGASFVVYSIGRDRQDDGGVPIPPGAHSDTAGDLTFALRR